MSRNLSPELLSLYRSTRYQRAFLAHLDYLEDPVFANNRTFPIEFDWDNSGTPTLFAGVGEFATVSVLKELTERRVQRITLTLNGCDPDLLAKHLDAEYMGRRGHIWEAGLDADWQLVEAAPLFAGEIAQQSIRMGRLASVTVTLASIEEDWETVRASSYNGRDQRRIVGREDDEGLDWVETFATGRKIKWGRA